MEIIPWPLIFAQFFNFSVLVVLGVYFLRKRLSLYFREKREVFFKKMKTHKERAFQLEEEKKKLQSLIDKVTESFEIELEKTKKEAEKRYKNLISEGREFVHSLKKREEENRKKEEERAFQSLMQGLLNLSLKAAKESLKSLMNKEQKTRLEGEFLNRRQGDFTKT